MERSFRTLRGFIDGDEPDEPSYFAHSASLRVFGKRLEFDRIAEELGLQPTKTHREGERAGPRSPPYDRDLWLYAPPIHEERPLAEHIDALWHAIGHAERFLLEYKKVADIDVFLGYRSNVDHPSVQVPHTCLEMFTRLQIPFCMSIIIT